MNPCRRSSSPMASPSVHFFKIILPSALEDKKLKIPKNFAMRTWNELCDAAKLIVPNRQIWHVQLTRDSKGIWFDDGLQEFLEYNSISVGYFLLFRHIGGSDFHVRIFDMSACEIQYPCDGLKGDEQSNHGKQPEEEKTTDDSLVVLDSRSQRPSTCSLKRKVVDQTVSNGKCSKSYSLPEKNIMGINQHPRNAASLGSPNSEVSLNSRSIICIKEEQVEWTDLEGANESERKKPNKKAMRRSQRLLFKESNVDKISKKCKNEVEIITSIQFAKSLAKASQGSKRAVRNARMFKPKNPSFMVLVYPSIFNKCVLHVPSRFAKKYLNGVSDCINIQGASGREWLVGTIWTSCSLFLSHGLVKFVRHNNLVEGDVCVFELLKKTREVTLQSSIFYAADGAGPVNKLVKRK